MELVVVENSVFINKENKILPKWKGDSVQESELMQKLYGEYLCRFLPFTPAYFYYLYWCKVWRGIDEVMNNMFYEEVVEPVVAMKGYSYVRWAPKNKYDFGDRAHTATTYLLKNSLVHVKKEKGRNVVSLSNRGMVTAKRGLESLWYFIKLVEYALERDDKDLISKLLKVRKYKAVTPEELRKEIYYM